MDYLPHQQRVIAERDDLSEKLNKLRAFIGSHKFNDVTPPERMLLWAQDQCMNAYLTALNKRIELWQSHAPTSVLS
jgi:hypothetical protein